MSWTFLEQRVVTAKKEHICLCCGEPILPKEKYVRRIGIDDGFITMKMHPECEKASSSWDDEDWETFDRHSMERPKESEAHNEG